MADTTLFGRLRRLFSSNIVVRNVGGNRLKIADTGRMVTKYISEVNFERAVRPGQLIKLYGQCLKIGKTSVTIQIEARRHSIYNGTQKPVCKCNIVFVRIDGDGEPVPIAPHVRYKLDKKEME